jgi:hypothetical protein
MNPTLDAGKTRRLADIDTEKVDKLPAGKARDALRRKPATTNQPRADDCSGLAPRAAGTAARRDQDQDEAKGSFN